MYIEDRIKNEIMLQISWLSQQNNYKLLAQLRYVEIFFSIIKKLKHTCYQDFEIQIREWKFINLSRTFCGDFQQSIRKPLSRVFLRNQKKLVPSSLISEV